MADIKKTLNKREIFDNIQRILNIAHAGSHEAKRKINETENDLTFADPIGGDSTKNPYTKRCHLYWNTLKVVSYDDDGFKMSYLQLCKQFDIKITADQRTVLYDHIDNNISYTDYNDNLTSSSLQKLINLNDLVQACNIQNEDTRITDLKPIQKGSPQYHYLQSRGIINNPHIYQATYHKTSEWKEQVIIILNKKNDNVLGMQLRNLKSGYKRLFKIYNYEKTLEIINKDALLEMDINDVIMYNKLSYFYNILNVDFSREITIFEGYIDSIFYSNSIGVVGVNTDLRFLESNGLLVQYFYDNDKAGWRKSDQKIKEGYRVFLWNKLFEHIINTKKPNDPHKLLDRLKTTKDLNQLYLLNSKLPLRDFFSNDKLDIMYIPKVKEPYKKYVNKRT